MAMIIADKKKIIFIHIEKTAGTSIAALLLPYISEAYRSKNARKPDTGRGWRKTWHANKQHAKFSESLAVIDKLNIDPQQYFKFAVVRNPYSWLLSIWDNRYQPNLNAKAAWKNKLRFQIAKHTGVFPLPAQRFHQMYPDGSFKSFVLFIDYLLSNYSSSFTKGFLGASDQYSYIENDRNIKFDFIAKLETLDRDLEKINQIVRLDNNFKPSHLNQKNKTESREKYLDYYDDESIAIVNRIFARDFEIFGYQPIVNLAKYQKSFISL